MLHKKAASSNTNNSATEAKDLVAKDLVSVSVVGARGYSGLELVKLLLRHERVKLAACFATKSFSLSQDILDPRIKDIPCLTEDRIMEHLTDIVFLATPAEVSLKMAPEILKAGKKVIDLSGAFRLKKNDYSKWYGFDHTEPLLLEQAGYGLMPFAGPVNQSTKLIANPGCYATAISLALIPLLKNRLIDPGSIVIDAKSGTTGGGRKASENLLFAEVTGDCRPYKVGRHQHLPEIQEAVETWGGLEIDPHFSTHLLPVKSGLTAAIYATLSPAAQAAEIDSAYAQAYSSYPLVRFGAELEKFSSLSKVVGTPFTHISYELVGKKLFVFSLIDNLQKGAASQAVENLNRCLDLPPHFSLV